MDQLYLNQMEVVSGGADLSLNTDDSDEIRVLAEMLKRSGDDKDEAMSYLRQRYYANPAEQLRKIINEVYGK